ncbi:hypothetical protein BJ742DRAFT_778961 [Cladochytrium replicatum]|nr:hypothetical protein BJ742DRAFT_778961 [Cladochytrium replicatum]
MNGKQHGEHSGFINGYIEDSDQGSGQQMVLRSQVGVLPPAVSLHNRLANLHPPYPTIPNEPERYGIPTQRELHECQQRLPGQTSASSSNHFTEFPFETHIHHQVNHPADSTSWDQYQLCGTPFISVMNDPTCHAQSYVSPRYADVPVFGSNISHQISQLNAVRAPHYPPIWTPNVPIFLHPSLVPTRVQQAPQNTSFAHTDSSQSVCSFQNHDYQNSLIFLPSPEATEYTPQISRANKSTEIPSCPLPGKNVVEQIQRTNAKSTSLEATERLADIQGSSWESSSTSVLGKMKAFSSVNSVKDFGKRQNFVRASLLGASRLRGARKDVLAIEDSCVAAKLSSAEDVKEGRISFGEIDAVSGRRQKNTLSAQRSRARKRARIEGLEESVQQLEEHSVEMVQQILTLESERKRRLECQEANEKRILELEQSIKAAKERLLSSDARMTKPASCPD